MKRSLSIFAMVSLLLGATLGAPAATTNSMTAALQQGLFEEEANNNLEAAIQAYKSVISQFDRDRKLAATAIYRLGECYRKQAKTNEAVVHYERIVREFLDVATLATLSRQNLAGLSAATASKEGTAQVGSGSPLSSPVTSQEEEEIKRIRALIQNSPDLINANTSGYTPLHKAAMAGQLVVARFLLENGAAVNAKTLVGAVPDARSPLHLAAANGHLAMVQLLLQNKAGVNATDREGQTPLHPSAGNGFTAIVEELLRAGADPNAKNNSGFTPLHGAAQSGHYATAEMLLANKADVTAQSGDGRTPLHQATANGHTMMAGLLLKRGAQVNARSSSGQTALALAVESGHMETVKVLLANKADPNLPTESTDDSGTVVYYPLHKAVKNSVLDLARVLLENKADPNAPQTRNKDVSYPLHLAIWAEAPGMVAMLLAKKADPNVQTGERKQTPLIVAITKPLENTSVVLLDHKADVNIPDLSKNTALHYSLGQPRIFELVLAADANVNAANEVGETPLHWAVSSGLGQQVAELIKRGANINAPDKQGLTPLHMAVLAKNKEMLALLLSNKADPNIKDFEGRTPLDLERIRPGLGMNEYRPAPGVSVYRIGYAPTVGYLGGFQRSTSTRPELAELLRQHGAMDVLPDKDSIKFGRADKVGPERVFNRGTNDWNQFTLLEVLGAAYRFLETRPDQTRLDIAPKGFWLAFPDFSRITIRRPTDNNLATWSTQRVDVAEILTSGDCSKDLSLKWGDVVDVPETDHLLNETWSSLPSEIQSAMWKCLSREVEIVVKGKRTRLTLGDQTKASGSTGFYTPASTSIITTWLRPVLMRSGVLLASSDLSRIKVTRADPTTGAKKEYVLDCSERKPAPDFWLRDGDVIDVPDK